MIGADRNQRHVKIAGSDGASQQQKSMTMAGDDGPDVVEQLGSKPARKEAFDHQPSSSSSSGPATSSNDEEQGQDSHGSSSPFDGLQSSSFGPSGDAFDGALASAAFGFHPSGGFASYEPLDPDVYDMRHSTGKMAEQSPGFGTAEEVTNKKEGGAGRGKAAGSTRDGEVYDLRHSTGGIHAPSHQTNEGGYGLQRRLSDISWGSESSAGDHHNTTLEQSERSRASATGIHHHHEAVDQFLSDPSNNNWDDLVQKMKRDKKNRKGTAGPSSSRQHRGMNPLERSAIVDDLIARNLHSLVAEVEPNDDIPCIDVYSPKRGNSPASDEGPPLRRKRSGARKALALVRSIQERGAGDLMRSIKMAPESPGSSKVEGGSRFELPRNLRTLVWAADDDVEEAGAIHDVGHAAGEGRRARKLWRITPRMSTPLMVGVAVGMLVLTGCILATTMGREDASNQTPLVEPATGEPLATADVVDRTSNIAAGTADQAATSKETILPAAEPKDVTLQESSPEATQEMVWADEEATILPSAAEPKDVSPQGSPPGEPDLSNFCNECQWKTSPVTCGKRVQWEMEHFQLTATEARRANLEHCTAKQTTSHGTPSEEPGQTKNGDINALQESPSEANQEAEFNQEAVGPEEPDLSNFCDACRWKNSPFTCGKRVEWEVERFQLSVTEAKRTNLEFCTAP